ncbi:hypothetical protein J32TS6_32150 [Virgibacillus pantothenticus]|uniref:ACT domain-containing protein n=1 Tax=Virgibacillus pantothenticus TaxID=1473 RepID=A0A0L0QKV8_VIRPA|nr:MULTISPECIES: hypothetical protein [Virgibacillus]API91463.1 hypothetical protein BKP57_06170 [Virgibacillus sp. 6R]KNE19222.1 hypothetical protein AFK71_11860 [Virgibacillus pantothenticus]MBS7427436.1 hypothetical protein [Virgibacillus sp. 19R1-5]MBU8568886.1 hypothetical protein [Virgibacillus pantothenticus]MBU8602118.1 hypothetical protein [Virgibacillus pantothenticus]
MNVNNYRLKLYGRFKYSMLIKLVNIIKQPFITIVSLNEHQIKTENLIFLRIELQISSGIEELNSLLSAIKGQVSYRKLLKKYGGFCIQTRSLFKRSYRNGVKGNLKGNYYVTFRL